MDEGVFLSPQGAQPPASQPPQPTSQSLSSENDTLLPLFSIQPFQSPTQHHSTTSRTPYSSSSRPARPALLPSRPATGRSSSVPQTASISSHTQSHNLHSSTGRPGRDRNGPGSGGRRTEGTGAGGKKEGVDGGQHVKTLKEWVGTRKRGKGLIDLSVSQV